MFAIDDAQLKKLRREVQLEVTLSVLVIVALIVYGLLRFPTTLTASSAGIRGLAGAVIILLVYEIITLWELPGMVSVHPIILPLGLLIGAGIGLLFAVQMLVEYLLPITSGEDGALAVATFGGVFLLFFLCGLIGGFRSGRVRAGLFSAIWSALTGSLIWFILVLATYYFFLGTAMEAHFLQIDQTLADFQRSGMSDLRAFILQDLMGGGFFHLLLAPLFAALFGAFGGLVGKFAGRLLFPNFNRGDLP